MTELRPARVVAYSAEMAAAAWQLLPAVATTMAWVSHAAGSMMATPIAEQAPQKVAVTAWARAVVKAVAMHAARMPW